MDKELKRQKKARQYERRMRALEDQVYKLQCLVKEQHAMILLYKSYLDMNATHFKELNGKQIEEQGKGAKADSFERAVLELR